MALKESIVGMGVVKRGIRLAGSCMGSQPCLEPGGQKIWSFQRVGH